MQKFEEKKFNFPKFKGVSEKTTDEHLKLYAGYVKNANLILEHIDELTKDSDSSIGSTGSGQANAYVLGELQRRFSFEFGGMRNHEYYFASLEGGPKDLEEGSAFKKTIIKEFDDFDKWLTRFKAIALTRGIGWAMLYWDRKDERLLNAWVDEQHMGQLQDCAPILALDMWEHAFVADYQPSGKKQYIEDFFANLNWEVIEKNFIKTQ